MAKPTAQQCHALTTYFVGKVKEDSGKAPVVNRNKARWGFESVLMDFSPSDARELIDFYVAHWERPSIEWFLFNYDKVCVAREEHEEDARRRAERRRITQERVERWRQRPR